MGRKDGRTDRCGEPNLLAGAGAFLAFFEIFSFPPIVQGQGDALSF